MSCTTRYIELGNMLDRKEVPATHGKKWYKFAYRRVTGKRLPLFWRFDKVLKEVYHPGNVIDSVAEQGMLS
jgi:hypothetical protein